MINYLNITELAVKKNYHRASCKKLSIHINQNYHKTPMKSYRPYISMPGASHLQTQIVFKRKRFIHYHFRQCFNHHQHCLQHLFWVKPYRTGHFHSHQTNVACWGQDHTRVYFDTKRGAKWSNYIKITFFTDIFFFAAGSDLLSVIRLHAISFLRGVVSSRCGICW